MLYMTLDTSNTVNTPVTQNDNALTSILHFYTNKKITENNPFLINIIRLALNLSRKLQTSYTEGIFKFSSNPLLLIAAVA